MAVIGGFKVNWYDKEVLNAVKATLKNVTKEVAQDVERDAKRILKEKAKNTTEQGLVNQFSIQEDDGFLQVWCQGPKKWSPRYHASFFELGTPKTGVHPYGNKNIPAVKLEAKPFMRPARKKNIPKARKKWQEAIDKL